MKALRILSILLLAGFLFSCEKDVKDEVKMGEVSFGIEQIDPMLKTGGYDWPICSDKEPVSALIKINGVSYNPLVFYLNDKLYTQAIKLPVGTYDLDEFYLLDRMWDGNTPPEGILSATPTKTSAYKDYVDKPVKIENFIVVEPFQKLEYKIEVLCYEPGFHEQFGFFWFNITEIVVREICFFGDLCLKDVASYQGSAYGDVLNLDNYPFDLPAIFQIHAFKKVDGNWVQYDTFSNVYFDAVDGKWKLTGENLKVCAKYPDRPDRTDDFKFVLKVLVKVGNTFQFVEFYDGWEFTNTNPLVAIESNQKVVTFVIGECNAGTFTYPDKKFAAYQNLPKEANLTVTSIITNNNYPVNGGYWKIKTNSFLPANAPQTGYEFPNPTDEAIAWCGDAHVTLPSPTTGNFEVHSTLVNTGWVNLRPHMTLERFKRVNWLFNNLHLLTDSDGKNYGYPALTGLYVTGIPMPGETNSEKQQAAKDLQHAIWLALGQTVPNNISGGGPVSADAVRMAHLAETNYNSFVPLPGTYAGVLLIKDGNPKTAQLVFIMVDP